jgi:putative aldouronate transport system substrate-binding protein
LPDFLKAKCADLTPYLAGDAVKDYPNLAAIPPYSWKNSISAIDGKLYLIPLHRPLPGTGAASHSGYFFKNIAVWDKAVGPGYVPKNADDLKRVLLELNRPKENYWAIGDQVSDDNAGLPGYAQMFRAPHGWRLESSGALTHKFEAEEFKTAVGYVRDLWAAGVFHPDSNGSGGTTNDFAANKFATGVFGYGNGWVQMWRTGLQQKPPVQFAIMPPFAFDGGTQVNYLTGGFLSLQTLKQGTPDRIKELLRIMDWLAAPFGSQEDLLMTYGLKDQDYALDANGSPVATANGKLNAASVPWFYVAQHPYVNYQADLPGFAQTFWDAEHATIPTGIYDPTLGFYSATNYAKGAAAYQTASDGINDIILGRQPMSAYDSIVKTWAAAAGDQIRKEYTQAITAAK